MQMIQQSFQVGLQNVLDKPESESKIRGLAINIKKTVCMVASRKSQLPEWRLSIGGKSIKQVNKFKYLGSWIMSDGKCDQDIRRRTSMAKEAFQRMKPILATIKLSMKVRSCILHCYTHPILVYGLECWTNLPKMRKCIGATEVWFLRRMLGIPWMSHMTNVQVLKQVNMTRWLLGKMKKQQVEFIRRVEKEGNGVSAADGKDWW